MIQKHAKVTLEQWRALAAVVDQGGYAAAAEALGKSQSTVSHNIGRLEDLLGTRVLKIEGRRAVLTEVGSVVLRRARSMLTEAADVERMAHTLSAGIEAEVAIAVDTIFPNQILLPALQAFSNDFPDTRMEVFETVITGVEELLTRGEVQIAITPHVPQGWMGTHLISLQLVCVAHPDHPLHQLDRPLTQTDLARHRQLVVRETADRRDSEVAWLGSEQRLTVSTMGTRIQALCQGLGFAWSPVLKIQRELDEGLLKILPLEHGGERFVQMYLFLADEMGAGPATRAMADAIALRVSEC